MHVASRLVLLLSAFLVLSAAVSAQTVTPNPELKKWEPVIGKWVNQEELRTKPDGPWEKVSSEWEIRRMPGGFFLDTPGRMTWANGKTVSWIEVVGYDAVKKSVFDAWFTSAGNIGTATWEWVGTTLRAQGTEVEPNGGQLTVRCSWLHSPDYRSVEGTCEQLSDGKWWVNRKVKGTRQ
jgi:hypothetical protein